LFFFFGVVVVVFCFVWWGSCPVMTNSARIGARTSCRTFGFFPAEFGSSPRCFSPPLFSSFWLTPFCFSCADCLCADVLRLLSFVVWARLSWRVCSIPPFLVSWIPPNPEKLRNRCVFPTFFLLVKRGSFFFLPLDTPFFSTPHRT